MRKLIIPLVIVLSVIGAALPTGSAVVAQEPLLVWHTISSDADGALARVASAYEQQTGVPVTLEFMREQVLFEAVAAARASGAGGPDVVITGNPSLVNLLDGDLINVQSGRGTFFLSALIDGMPDLLEAECGSTDVATECLWPRVGPALVTADLERATLGRAWNWICGAADWMVPCDGGNWPGAAVSWSYNIYLINETWLAENGLDVPFDVEEINDVRRDYGLEYVWAETGSIPLAQDAQPNAVYVMPSALITDDPNGMMRAMDSFYQAGYLPVVELGIDGAYVSVTASDAAQAANFVTFFPRPKSLLLFAFT